MHFTKSPDGTLHSVHHHKLPKRFDKGMSVSHLCRRLKGHPPDALINGLFQVHGSRPWLVKATSNHTVAAIVKFLHDYDGNAQMAHLDLHVTVEVRKRSKADFKSMWEQAMVDKWTGATAT